MPFPSSKRKSQLKASGGSGITPPWPVAMAGSSISPLSRSGSPPTRSASEITFSADVKWSFRGREVFKSTRRS